MPPKKKRKVALPEKPGIVRQFLEENFDSVPSENVKNGHVLYLYIHCNNSLAETMKLLKQKVIGDCYLAAHHIHSLVNKTLKKYGPSSGNINAMTKLKDLCHEHFLLTPAPEPQDPPRPNMSAVHEQDDDATLTAVAGPSMMVTRSQEWRKFFDSTKQPENFERKKDHIKDFIQFHEERGTKVVLVTSGGTTVPLESKTVRFIDNFSVGTRGSVSAEFFLQKGYAVIFLHRNRSLQPFHRFFARTSILDVLTIGEGSKIKVKDEHADKIYRALQIYEKTMKDNQLLMIEYTTLADYLHLLKDASLLLASQGRNAMIYLAAAVSDFYIPSQEMPEHKIQSSSGPLTLSLKLVPKMLEPLVKDWAPEAFVVSFKLETDEAILLSKCQSAISKYNHQVVIGNQLDTRKRHVLTVTKDKVSHIRLTDDEIKKGPEIESYIIEHLKEKHIRFIES